MHVFRVVAGCPHNFEDSTPDSIINHGIENNPSLFPECVNNKDGIIISSSTGRELLTPKKYYTRWGEIFSKNGLIGYRGCRQCNYSYCQFTAMLMG